MLNIILTLIAIVLFYSVVLLLGNINERIRLLKGEELDYVNQSRTNGKLFTLYGILFLLLFFLSFKLFDYASLPEAASTVGNSIDRLFLVTAIITGFVFVLTHIALFYFVWKYREDKSEKATFFAHSNSLEILWTTIPALTMAVLVIMGLSTWFQVFPNSKKLPANQMQIEVTGKQFNWVIRYPGPDGVFGRRIISNEYVNPENELGIDWTDPASHDDFFASDLYMVKDRPVHFNLGAQDVLHSFYLPHFRIKMDCVPGVPTGIGFTPSKTNDETRELLKKNSHWASINPETNEPRYKDFKYELACAELCGKSHYGMLVNVYVVTQKEFDKWASEQKPYFEQNKEKLLAMMPKTDNAAPHTEGTSAKAEEHKSLDIDDMIEHGITSGVVYETGDIIFKPNSDELTSSSKTALDEISAVLEKFSDKKITLTSHTDSDGEDAHNKALSEKRAIACKNYLVSKGVAADRIDTKGMGESQPIASNDTPEGKEKNRRTEITFN